MAEAVDVSFHRRARTSYFLKVSLHHRAVVKIAVNLWTNNYLVYSPQCNPEYEEMKRQWKFIELSVKNTANVLNLERPLREEVQYIVQLIGFRILAWVDFHRRYYINIPVPKMFFWTPRGTIDLKETAKFILKKSQKLDDMSHYRLACIYCFNDEAYELWKKLDFEHKNLETEIQYEGPIIQFWTYYFANKARYLMKMMKVRPRDEFSPYELALNFAVTDCNEPAARYFIQKVNCQRKVDVVSGRVMYLVHKGILGVKSPGTKDELYCDVLCCLLSALTLEQQKEMLIFYSPALLQLFLQWPWLDYFMQAAEYIVKDIRSVVYEDVLLFIFAKIKQNHKDYDYRNVFRIFWEKRTGSQAEFVAGRNLEFLHSLGMCNNPVNSDAQPLATTFVNRKKAFYVRDAKVEVHKINLICFISRMRDRLGKL